MVAAGSLIFVDVIKQKPFTLAVQALQLATLAVSQVAVIGPSSSFYDQVSAISDDGLHYYATVQKTGAPLNPFLPSSSCAPVCTAGSKCCRDPAPNSTAACFAVSECSDINKGHKITGETVAVSLATGQVVGRMNTSSCFKLAYVAGGEILCLAGNAAGHIEIHRLDFSKHTSKLVGTFDEACDATMNEAAAYDATSGIFYAYLASVGAKERASGRLPSALGGGTTVGALRRVQTSRTGRRAVGGGACPDGVYAMDTKTGKLLPPRTFDEKLLVMDFEIDRATGRTYAAVNHEDGAPPHTVWSKGLVALNLTAGDAGDPIAWEFISKDAYGRQSVGKCEAGNSTGAAKHCYFQLNNAAYGNGTFFLNAFQEPTSPESVVATDATTGRVLFEHSPSTSNVIDMAWTKWTPAGSGAGAQ